MKTSIWDILTGVILLGIICMVGAFVTILANPHTAINPLPPSAGIPGVITPIVMPAASTPTQGLPPTWTPTATQENTQAPVNSNGLRPSSTPLPTNTVVVLPTFTPSTTPRTGLGGGTCLVVNQTPADNSYQTNGSTFPVRWIIKNTSSDTWRSDSVDIDYVSGGRYHSGNDVIDMPYDVAPGGMLDWTVNLTAPNKNGSYVSNWKLAAGDKTLCAFYITFQTH